MVGYFAMIFLLLAGIDHLLVATVFRKSYEEQLVCNDYYSNVIL